MKSSVKSGVAVTILLLAAAPAVASKPTRPSDSTAKFEPKSPPPGYEVALAHNAGKVGHGHGDDVPRGNGNGYGHDHHDHDVSPD